MYNELMETNEGWKDGVDLKISRELGFLAYMAEVLKKRLGKDGPAERMGFKGVKDKKVLDVGTRDGRYIKVFESLGASETYGLEPDQK